MKTIILNELLDLDKLAREEIKRKAYKKRELIRKISAELGKHFLGIIGPRGVGKSTILRQLAIETEHSFYISLDVLKAIDLFEIAKILKERYKIRLILIDEIHNIPDYFLALKKIYDFLDLRIIFTSSVSLSMAETSTDLSRRVKMFFLPPFSFKEYILFKEGNLLPNLTLEDIIADRYTSEYMRTENLFTEYLKGGLMPFSLEEPDILPLLKNILDKVIEKDIPAVARLFTEEIGIIHKCVEFIGSSSVDDINYSSLSKNIGITKYKAERYIELLQKGYILNAVFPSGTNVLREPKILMCLPYRLLYKDYDAVIGALREDFFVETARMSGLEISYLKSTRGKKTPDYLIKDRNKEIVVEIGGKSKGREQFKGIKISKKLILSHSLKIDDLHKPLFLAGFL